MWLPAFDFDGQQQLERVQIIVSWQQFESNWQYYN